LVISDSLDIDLDTLRKWNDILKKIFADPNNVRKWNNIFKPSYLLRNEKVLYKEILSIE
jgi:hypothetical protein